MSTTKKYKTYKLDDFVYRELVYFCLQYPRKKAELSACYGAGIANYEGMPHGSGTSNPTASQAERADKWLKDCELVEQSAIAADAEIYQYLINNVTFRGMPYEYLNVPCGKNQFYEARRKFFCILNQKKNG